jgi:hypothetical protein
MEFGWDDMGRETLGKEVHFHHRRADLERFERDTPERSRHGALSDQSQ